MSEKKQAKTIYIVYGHNNNLNSFEILRGFMSCEDAEKFIETQFEQDNHYEYMEWQLTFLEEVL